MRPELTLLQQRVLGVLIEKSLSQPAYYPMTLNAIAAGCNQKQNRHPVMTRTEAEIAKTIHELQQMGLVSLAPPAPGARSNRFAHEAHSKLEWDRPQQALMAELLLRGPQTVGELRTRAGRMSASFESLDVVSNVLNDLATREPPMAVELEREPGKSATRFAHMLCTEDQLPRQSAVSDTAMTSQAVPPGDWVERIETLESKLDQLTERLARLEAKVNTRLP
ncbi:MAG: DUF480 domain-containing protein [Phycisphaerales bacterium]|nr:MAG: DUF480 domain-containing protein [Phycisphaerales bacterium]